MNQIQQVGPRSFAAVQQELYDYRNLLKTEDRIVSLKAEKPRIKGSNAPNFTLKGFKDPELNAWLGWPVRVKEDGTYEFRSINFTGPRSFNLKNQEEAYEYFMWTRSCYFKGSPLNLIDGRIRQCLVEYDENKERIQYVESRKKANKMEAIMMEWNEEQIKEYAMLYKLNPKLNSTQALLSMLLNKLNNNPDQLKAEFDNYEGHTQYMITYRKAEFAGILKEVAGRGVMYRETTTLGATIDQVIARFKKDTQLYIMIKNDAETTLPSGPIRPAGLASNPISEIQEKFQKDARQAIEVTQPTPVDVEELIDKKLNSFASNLMGELKTMLASKDVVAPVPPKEEVKEPAKAAVKVAVKRTPVKRAAKPVVKEKAKLEIEDKDGF